MLRRGTAEEWMRINPQLNIGEPGYEIDTNRLKIGNGFDDWLSLPYISSPIIMVDVLPIYGMTGILYIKSIDYTVWIWYENEYICINNPTVDISNLTQNTNAEIIFDCGGIS